MPSDAFGAGLTSTSDTEKEKKMEVPQEQVTPNKKWPSPGKIITVVVLLIVVVFAAWKFYKLDTETPRGQAVTEITKGGIGLEANQIEVAKLIAINFEEYRNNTRWWSLAYFTFVFLSAALSALAGVILKLEYFVKNEGLRKDVAALLAVIAAILIAITTNGDFQRKWQANRIAASGIENLAYDLLKKPFTDEDKTRIVNKIQELSLKRNQEIVGDDTTSSETRDTQKGNKEGVDSSDKNKGNDKQGNANANK